MNYKFLLLMLTIPGGVFLTASFADAQMVQSYGKYYMKQSRLPAGVGPGSSVDRYLYDKYFQSKSWINPSMGLDRRSSVSDYYQYVRPEQARRAKFDQASRKYIQERKLQEDYGHTNYGFARELREGVPSASAIPPLSKSAPTNYNQWYGR